MKVVIVNFTGQRENWGSQATSWELHAYLRRILQPLGLTELSVVPFPPGHLLDTWVQWKHGHRIRQILSNRQPSPDDLDFLEQLCAVRFGKLLARVKDADIVLFQGEGSMGAGSFLENVRLFALPYLAKHKWRKIVIALNLSVDAASRSDLELSCGLLSDFDLVVLREARSHAVCLDLGLADALLVPDMAFRSTTGARLSSIDLGASLPVTSESYFCISGSAGLQNYDLEAFAGTCRQVSVNLGLRAVFMYSRMRDYSLASALGKTFPRDDILFVTRNSHPRFEQMLPVLRNARFLLGGRYHTAISALTQRTPIILTSANSQKNEGIGALLGIEMPVRNYGDREALIADAHNVHDRNATLREDIHRAVCRLDAIYDAFATVLAGIVRGKAAKEALHPVSHILAPTPNNLPTADANFKRPTKGLRLKRMRIRNAFASADLDRAIKQAMVPLSLRQNLEIYDAEPWTAAQIARTGH
ncbi:MAG: polysaccharide pyruvyl transferase family protein [Paracoccaceae bacterium]